MNLFLICLTSLQLFAFNPLQNTSDFHEPKLKINNRILVTVMNKPITVLDVVKKMNVILEQNYPEYRHIDSARHQFYSQQWKTILYQMIDSELMLKDAEKLEIKLSDAEIREEIHSRFGPNIMKSLSSIGISYDEAKKMTFSNIYSERGDAKKIPFFNALYKYRDSIYSQMVHDKEVVVPYCVRTLKLSNFCRWLESSFFFWTWDVAEHQLVGPGQLFYLSVLVLVQKVL